MPLRLRRRKGSPNWYVRGTVRAISVDESTGTDNRDAAEAIRIKREAELLDRSVFGTRATATFLEAAAIYLETCGAKERKRVRRLVDHFGETPIAKIGHEAIERCVARLCKPGVAPATINREILAPLGAVLHTAARKDLADWKRIARRKEPKPRDRWLTPDDAEKLIEHAPDSIRVLTIFLFCTGCRLGEALALDWAQVDLARRHCVFLNTKNGDHRGASLTERLFVELANLPGKHDGKVFPIPLQSVYYPWSKMCIAAGVENFRPHDCRHTWATWMRREGQLDLIGLMNAGSWRDPGSVARYTHVVPDETRVAYDRLSFGRATKKA